MAGDPGELHSLFALQLGSTEEAQRALRRFERLATLGTTLAGAAHELNNPLAAIIGFAQLLRTRPLAPDDLVAVETILREAERTARIVRDLLAVVRQRESGEPSAVNVNDVVGYVAGTRRYTLETNDISCTIALDPSLPRVLGDRAQLEQVVLNLLLNAEQSLGHATAPTARPGAIHVRTRRAEGSVVIEVIDNGSGVSSESAERIWDPFFTTRPEAGSGLGLSVVRGIVTAHGGTATLHTTEGGGATFEVRLPAAGDVHDEPVPSVQPQPRDILVVDQDAQSGEFLRGYLAARGHAVLSTASGADALSLAGRARFDALIADAATVDPVDRFVASLRALAGGCSVRIVLAVADGRQLAPELQGEVSLLPKPYDLDQLRRLIESA